MKFSPVVALAGLALATVSSPSYAGCSPACASGEVCRYEAAGKLAGAGSNLLAWFSGGSIKELPGPFAAWTDTRNFPPFAARSFREQWRERQARRKKIGRKEE